jgi:TonB-dependent SusC/RagA subfamily outer membrane receptor
MRAHTLLLTVAPVLLIACSQNRSSQPPQDTKNANAASDSQWVGQNATRVEELFVGRFPGVEVWRVPEGLSVRIRGATSVMGSTEPLYVIDGMTIDPGPGGALVGLNPADIEKIEVLKDAGSTAMYGVRGANGVILIKTKRGPSKQ